MLVYKPGRIQSPFEGLIPRCPHSSLYPLSNISLMVTFSYWCMLNWKHCNGQQSVDGFRAGEELHPQVDWLCPRGFCQPHYNCHISPTAHMAVPLVGRCREGAEESWRVVLSVQKLSQGQDAVSATLKYCGNMAVSYLPATAAWPVWPLEWVLLDSATPKQARCCHWPYTKTTLTRLHSLTGNLTGVRGQWWVRPDTQLGRVIDESQACASQ